mgnify:CR=1 FL=1
MKEQIKEKQRYIDVEANFVLIKKDGKKINGRGGQKRLVKEKKNS